MKKYFLIAFVCLHLTTSAQVAISVGTGVGTYFQDDLKEFQQDFLDRYNVDGEINANFPAYINYEGSISFTYSPRLFSEVFFTYGSTGGRVSYSDYSGTVSMTQRVNYTAVMSSFGVRWRKEKYQFDFQMRLGRLFSRLTLEQFENVSDSRWSHKDKYTSEAGVFEPNFKLTRITGHLGIYASAGFSTTVSPSAFESENTVGYISTPQGEYIRFPDWTGLRLGAGVTLIIGRVKEQNNEP